MMTLQGNRVAIARGKKKTRTVIVRALALASRLYRSVLFWNSLISLTYVYVYSDLCVVHVALHILKVAVAGVDVGWLGHHRKSSVSYRSCSNSQPKVMKRTVKDLRKRMQRVRRGMRV